MRIDERRGVVGLLEIQASGDARNVEDDRELTENFYEQRKDPIAGCAPPSLRDALLYPKRGLSIF